MFAKIKDNAVVTFPYGIDELKIDNPHTKYPGNIAIVDVFPTTESSTIHGCELVAVLQDDAPAFNISTHALRPSRTPVFRDGSWFVGWHVIELTEEETSIIKNDKEAEVRTYRNQLLKESDWSQGKDIPDSISILWAEYRIELRNITQQETFPWHIVWPISPQQSTSISNTVTGTSNSI
jgi:hypothetical protein